MSTAHDPDHMFDRNFRAAACDADVPAGPSEELLSQCRAALIGNQHAAPRHMTWLRRPALLSTVGLAACLALAVGLLFPTGGGPTVRAATILARFNEQITAPTMIELTLDNIVVEQASLNGHLQIADDGVAGDLQVAVNEPGEDQAVEVDLSLGLSKAGGWVLIRKLVVSDPEVQPMLAWLFPAGSETMLKLPADATADGFNGGVGDVLGELKTARLLEAFRELVESQPESGATITEQSNGTLLLAITIEDATALKELVKTLATPDESPEIDVDLEARIDSELSDEDLPGLIGSTMEIVYEPTSETIRSFALRNFGEANGTISFALTNGQLDPALLDEQRVTGPNTRTIDLSALESMFEGMKTGG